MDKRLNMIFARRSIRSYTAEAVSAEQVKTLLEAAMAAPSTGWWNAFAACPGQSCCRCAIRSGAKDG